MIAAEIKLYELFRAKLGEKEAEALVEFVEAKVQSQIEQKKEQFITIADKEKLLTKADALTIFATKEDLAREIGNNKAELIKWMFIFWATQLLAIFTFLKLLK